MYLAFVAWIIFLLFSIGIDHYGLMYYLLQGYLQLK